MAPMPELKSPVALKIEAHYRDLQEPRDDAVLRCSRIGEPCERKLWYWFRWTTPLVRHEGRVERLFRTGHREEERMIADLRAIGVAVEDRDPATGDQWRVSFLNGIFTGSADGRAIGVPGAEKTEHLIECKTHNDKSFQDWRRKGVRQSKPVHFAQMQIYMHGLGLTRALYVGHNKNTDEVESERVRADPLAAQQIIAKAERIAFSDRAPPKNESRLCPWCPHQDICGGEAWARTNCRTCMSFEVGRDGVMRCARHEIELSAVDQRKGCCDHLFLPDLVPGEQIDANDADMTVTYELYDGTLYVDGADQKPNVPEILT